MAGHEQATVDCSAPTAISSLSEEKASDDLQLRSYGQRGRKIDCCSLHQWHGSTVLYQKINLIARLVLVSMIDYVDFIIIGWRIVCRAPLWHQMAMLAQYVTFPLLVPTVSTQVKVQQPRKVIMIKTAADREISSSHTIVHLRFTQLRWQL